MHVSNTPHSSFQTGFNVLLLLLNITIHEKYIIIIIFVMNICWNMLSNILQSYNITEPHNFDVQLCLLRTYYTSTHSFHNNNIMIINTAYYSQYYLISLGRNMVCGSSYSMFVMQMLQKCFHSFESTPSNRQTSRFLNSNSIRYRNKYD